jgi:hypothetical protein
MLDATALLAPFDARYKVINGGLFDSATPCASCTSMCTSKGTSCASGTCDWWGCWQSTSQAPGQYVTGFEGTTLADLQIPLVTYEVILQGSGVNAGANEVLVLQNLAFLRRYLADYRFMLQRLGSARVMIDIEPDFWGYAQEANADPHAEAAAVQAANPTDCAQQENSVAGLARCMVAMTRTYAPNALVGLHAASWATGSDALLNASATFDVAGAASQVGQWLVAAGADQADCVVATMASHDAGYDQSQGVDTWWDATNATLPNFHQAFAWGSSVASTIGKPLVWWQIPVGNMNLTNVANAWKDNRVDYLFTHMNEVAASGAVALFFGPGGNGQTSVETDGGNLVSRVNGYEALNGQPACP